MISVAVSPCFWSPKRYIHAPGDEKEIPQGRGQRLRHRVPFTQTLLCRELLKIFAESS